MAKLKSSIVPLERVEGKILILRGQRIMLDSDLAEIYGVPTKSLNLAVRRNRRRFPENFMFQLTTTETKNLRFQFETSRWGGSRYSPYAFTEHGAVMLASVLNSPTAVNASIMAVRAFIQLRQLGTINANLAIKIAELEDKYGKHDFQIQKIIRILRKLLEPPVEPQEPEKPPIGFRV